MVFPDRYKEEAEIGHGGNGVVYAVIDKQSHEKIAFKKLYDNWKSKRIKKERQGRFENEIRIVLDNQNTIPGILPILDYSFNEFWYTMPIAEQISAYIKREAITAESIVQGISEIAETLVHLHDKGISHRDIKPSNIYHYNDRFCLSDFGLVKNPSNENVFTRDDRGLGAIFTIAPEMKRNPSHSDGCAADVYSLAKTFWILLMNNDKGFDGAYDFRVPEISLHNCDKLKGKSIALLDSLLIDATKHNPQQRPTMVEFKSSLQEWLAIQNDWEQMQTIEWNYLKRYLFGDGTIVPNKAMWTKREDIVSVLNTVSALNVYNHMLLPSEGGLDFYRAENATEEGCICIETDSHGYILVRPTALFFESFDTDNEWNYFYLETGGLEPIYSTDEMYEYLVEDYPGNYVSAKFSQYSVYDYGSGKPLPNGYRVLDRYCYGSFLIVMKNGPYNGINGTYDARHSKMGHEVFSRYISCLIEIVHREERKGIDTITILHNIDNILPIMSEHEQLVEENEESDEHDSISEYIDKHLAEIDFLDCIEDEDSSVNQNCMYWISYSSLWIPISTIVERREVLLCKDGYFRESSLNHVKENSFLFNSIEQAQITMYRIKKMLCIKSGYMESREINETNCFRVSILRTGYPQHLFTKEEIRALMEGADDRYSNTLVIDKDGYAKILEGGISGPKTVFPVRLETWSAGNNYVGKFSKLNSVDSTYIMALEGWIRYLDSGMSVYIDYQEHEEGEKTEQELRDCIETIMRDAKKE